MGREFELKYQASAAALEALAAAFGPFRVISMETTYYDDPAGTLRQRRWTLRRRMENGKSVCTVKTNLPDGSRGEWETESPDITRAIPVLIAQGAPAPLAEVAARGLVPTCGAKFTRQAALLQTADGLAELALDSGILTGGGRQLPLSEVELELKEGSDQATVALARTLARRYGLVHQPKSKLARALELASQA